MTGLTWLTEIGELDAGDFLVAAASVGAAKHADELLGSEVRKSFAGELCDRVIEDGFDRLPADVDDDDFAKLSLSRWL